MNPESDFPLLLTTPIPIPLPVLAPHHPATSVPVAAHDDSAAAELRRQLARVVGDESALYAITRDWRRDIAGRKFTPLRALLDEQVTEIGAGLVQLAARSRALGVPDSTRRHDRTTPPRGVMDDGALEVHIMRELLRVQEALLKRLQEAKTIAADRVHDLQTTKVLADLMANHEKDAFMLRALLWEVQNTDA